MIIATGIFTIPSGKQNNVVAAMIKFSKSSRAVVGCITHGFYVDLEDANTIRFYGTWENSESFSAQLKSEHFTTIWDVFDTNGVKSETGGRFTITALSEDQ